MFTELVLIIWLVTTNLKKKEIKIKTHYQSQSQHLLLARIREAAGERPAVAHPFCPISLAVSYSATPAKVLSQSLKGVCTCVWVCVCVCACVWGKRECVREVSHTAAAAPSDCAFLCALLRQERCICLTVPASHNTAHPPTHSQFHRPGRQFVNKPVSRQEIH